MEKVNLQRLDGREAALQLFEVVKAKNDLPLEGLAAEAIISFPGWRHPEGHDAPNPFEILPKCLVNSLVDRFLAKPKLVLQPWQQRLLEMLLKASQTTKIDLTPWHQYQDLYTVVDIVVSHCTQLRELTLRFTGEAWWSQRLINRALCGLKELRVMHLKGVKVDPFHFELMGNNWDKLEILDVTVPESSFDYLRAAHFLKLANLKELHLGNHPDPMVILGNCQVQVATRALRVMEIVESLPCLQLLDIRPRGFINWGRFVQLFGQRCGGRQLTVELIVINQHWMEFDVWPPTLKVNGAQLVGTFTEEHLSLIDSIPVTGLTTLCLLSTQGFQVVLRLLKALAANVTDLTVFWRSPYEPFSLQQLLELAPKTKSFNLNVEKEVFELLKHPDVKLDASYFRTWTRFMANETPWSREGGAVDDKEGTGPLSVMFQHYLLGAEKLVELDIRMSGMLRVAVKTLDKNRDIGKDVRRLSVELRPSPDRAELQQMVLDLISLLILRYPCLEGVMLINTDIDRLSPDSINWFVYLVAAANVSIFVRDRRAVNFAGSPWLEQCVALVVRNN